MRYTRKNTPLTPFICYLKHDECNVGNTVKNIIIDNEIPIIVCHYAGELYYRTFNLIALKKILENNLNYCAGDYENFIYTTLRSLFNSDSNNYNSDTIYYSEIDIIVNIDEFMKSL